MKIASVLLLFLSLPPQTIAAQELAIINATVYPSPDAQPLSGTTILIHQGKIAAVGKRLSVPQGTPTLPCQNCVVFAGFWNCHVHFTELKWLDAAQQPAARLSQQLQTMLSGFTTVVDAASDPANTVALRRRIQTGEVLGPHIYTAGAGLYPPHAIPYYLNDLPPGVLAHLPNPDTPDEAAAVVRGNIAQGADIVKLFTGSIVSRGDVVPMPLAIAQAAVAAGHEKGQLVFAHPSNLEGVRVAMESGVDVLAHAPNFVAGVDDALLKQLIARHMAMVPTLKLFSDEPQIPRIREIVTQFHALGGQLLFGTDTGYLTDYSLTEEYHQLQLAGLTFRDVLTMLTTAPAERFKVSQHAGRIAPGYDGDLTILSANPAAGDMTLFADVKYAIRAGKVITGAP